MDRRIVLFILLVSMVALSVGAQSTKNTATSTPQISKRLLVIEKQHLNRIDSLEQAAATPQTILGAKMSLAHYYAIHMEFRYQADSIVDLIMADPLLDQDKALRARALTSKGLRDYTERNFQSAIAAHYEAIELRDQLNLHTRSYNYQLIGVNLMALENWKEALANYLKAQEILDDQEGVRPKLTQRIGDAYFKLNDMDQAADYYQRSIAEAKQQRHRLKQGTSLDKLARVYLMQGRHVESIKLLEESLVLRQGQIHQLHRVGAGMSLAKNYLALGQYAKARAQADGALQLARSMNEPASEQRVLRILVDIDVAEDKSKLAIQHYQELLVARDSFYSIENAKAFSELYTKLDLASKERDLLQQKITIQQHTRKTNRLYTIISILTLLGLLGALFYHNKFKHQKQIAEKNEVIQKALDEKEVLLKEVHHRVKNNLQVVSSLLGLQSLNIKDERAKAAISSGRSRVHSMSLIHQNLYKKGNLTGIEMTSYVNKLCKDLINTYQVSPMDIQLDVQVAEGLILDVETAVPVGLILNELITNALKYAFVDREQGLIRVRLVEENECLLLEVSDDGVGMDLSYDQDNSFGLNLIRSFQHKLDSHLDITSDHGTHIMLQINRYQLVK